MTLHRSIEAKLWLCVALLCAVVAVLAFSSLRGVYSYRDLARSVSTRAVELPLAGELSRSLGDLRVTLSRARSVHSLASEAEMHVVDLQMVKQDFRTHLNNAERVLEQYKEQLNSPSDRTPFGEPTHELATLDAVESSLKHLARFKDNPDWLFDQVRVESVAAEVDTMYDLTVTLPQHLHSRMHAFAGDVRVRYRAWIVVSWTMAILSGGFIVVLLWLFYRWIAYPLRKLIKGSRRIAGGDFNYRVQVKTHDEMAELAQALNDMTTRFREIRDDLDGQVKARTKEVIQSEQLAGVGFLAAGVAHEINNPLASIAWAAESLESRMSEFIEEHSSDEQVDAQTTIIRKYLKCIQDEAFRCKGITEKLLDFSRLGDMQKHDTDLNELVEGVIEMLRHLGKYRRKNIEFVASERVFAPIESQQMKQVVLNLIANAYDSLDPGGLVKVEVKKANGRAEIVVTDNGCGMTPEVLEHLFEPFFTRRRDGSGTGLGLSITYRIVQDHGGTIDARSEGPGQGSRFRVTLPLTVEKGNHATQRQENRLQAA